MQRIVEVVGAPDLGWGRRRRRTHFAELARAICFQQLAGNAARAIHGRFEALYAGAPTAAAVLTTPDDVLLAPACQRPRWPRCATSRPRSTRGTVSLARIGARADDAVVAELTQVRGIGRWTAEMFLIFQLRRLDVWPVDDLGVRTGYARIHGLAIPLPARELERGRRIPSLPVGRRGTAGAADPSSVVWSVV